MTRSSLIKLLAALIVICFVFSIPGPARASALAEKVRRMKIGIEPYFIGAALTAAQQKTAQKNPVAKPHPGTYKFAFDENVVVVNKENHRVLAIYILKDDLDDQGIKKAIADLMHQFGEPTTTGHDRLIYWAWGPKGKISQKTYKKAQTTGKISILATVKFSATEEVISPSANKKQKQKTSAYTLISSPPLLEKFMNMD